MERQTFVLLATKPFRHHLKLFISDGGNKTFQKIVTFTTEHKVTENERVTNARKKQAEYNTKNQSEIDALYRDTGYGKVFTHVDDPKGDRKKESFKVTPIDAEKIALRNLFNAAGLDFDGDKDVQVLNHEYRTYIAATQGVKIGESTASEIKCSPVDVQKTIQDQVNEAIKSYEIKYNKPFPKFDNKEDTYAFIDGLSNPNFNPAKYIEEKSVSEAQEGDDMPDTVEGMRELYKATFSEQVPVPKKNDIPWMKKKVKEYNK